MSIVAIIPARGGSKRIPGKNIKFFCGTPIIAYSIQAARQAQIFDRVLVSTDDDKVSMVAQQYGAEVPFRRAPELSDDFAGIDAVLMDALSWLQTDQFKPRYACCIHATAPFLRPEDLRRGFEQLQSEKATTAISVTTYPSSIFRAFRIDSAHRLKMLWPENIDRRSQDFEQVFHDAGQYYWVDVPRYLEEKRLFSADSVAVVIPPYRVQDIDTPEDWERAEKMFQASRWNADHSE